MRYLSDFSFSDGLGLEDVARLSAKKIFEVLGTSSKGLTGEEAQRRLAEQGPNVLVEKRHASAVVKFIANLRDLFSLLLLFAALLAAIGELWQLSLILIIVVIVNAVFGLFQEWRAERAMETLRGWMPEYAKVFRDGELRKILVRDLVLGDVIDLEEGDRVPADARLIEAFELWTNNVPLTGESEPQPRTSEPVEVADTTYLDAPNLVFMSTSVAQGRGRAVVFATGMKTMFGKIAGLAQEIRDELSPLQKEIAYTAKYDFIIAWTVGGIFFAVGLTLLHLAFLTSILFMIGVMVACVPEGLQVTVSSALAINVLKMVKRNVLVKRLSAVQTLGSVTVICTDKTGTITKGEMTVTKIWIDDRVVQVSGLGYTPIGNFTIDGKRLKKDQVPALERLLEISALCNSAKVEPPSDRNRSWSVIGDPTDGALLIASLKYGLNSQNMLVDKPIIRMVPFDSTRKRMTTIHHTKGGILVYTKGAPRSVLSLCTKISLNSKTLDLTKKQLQSVEHKLHEFASEGLRVIAIAFKEVPETTAMANGDAEKDLTLIGLVAMKDPPRFEVKYAVSEAKKAGTKIVIITGDYGPTAQAIAEEVGITNPGQSRVIRGVDLESMSNHQILEEVKKGEVIFARVTPEQKLRIVTVLKHGGEVVAVTGDGANDAPSLKEADIGIAMGLSGTDVARDASDLVLLDDSFASIVNAVESGRAIYENIRKFIIYVFAHNWAELIPFILYVLLNIPLPLLVVQVLAIDLGIDVIPSLALSREPPEPGIMEEPPRSVTERIFNRGVFLRSLYIGLIISAGAMFGCLNAWLSGGWRFGQQLDPSSLLYTKGTTMTFAGIVVAQSGDVLACRTNKTSIFKTSLRSNKWIWIGIAAQLSILSVIVYVPFLQGAFGTASLGPYDWLFLIGLAVIVVFVEEIRKFFARRLSKS
jgi:magnesium-transporting ATPase (P-type)